MGKEKGCHYEVERRHTRRRQASARESREQIRKGLGACVFLLGIPIIIAGIIITMVAYTTDDVTSLPASFPVLGPVLVVMAVLCFVIGSIMTDMLNVMNCWNCCLSNQCKNVCWKKCPKIFSLLYPDEVVRIQQRDAGLSALKTVPSKPALKHHVLGKQEHASLKHGVHFFSTDSYDLPRTSTSSDQSEIAVVSDSDTVQKTSPSSSLLSLRHFRIGPGENSKWVEMRHEPPVFENASFVNITEFADSVKGIIVHGQSQADDNTAKEYFTSDKHYDHQNGGITKQKSKQCDKKVVVFNVEDGHDEMRC